VIRREAIEIGERIAGPAIIEEFGTTTVIPPAWVAQAETGGAIFIRPA
jgi:N-methylhydantoinase A/oxoprolinase/acetone carboxylase beta subunit